MTLTFWIAYTNQNCVLNLESINHDEQDIIKNNKIGQVLCKEVIAMALKDVNHFDNVIACLRQHVPIHYKRFNNTFTLQLTNTAEINHLARMIVKTLIHNIFVYADVVFLRSAMTWEVNMKFCAVLRNSDNRQKCLDVLIDVAIACYVAAITNIDLVDGLKTTATSITTTAATNTATLGIESAAQVVGNAVAGAAISAIVDVAVSSATIYVAKRHKDEGRITEQEFSTKVKKTVCESSCKFVGGTTGSIIGQVLIPVPVLGAFVGGFCGSLIGAGIGKGINYSVFDRKTKKSPEEIIEEETLSHMNLYKRKFRGFVPKITVYNEAKGQFEEKVFHKTMKNYLRTDMNVDVTINKKTSKRNDKEMTATYLKRWRQHTSLDLPDDQHQEKHSIQTQKSVFSRWKKTVSTSSSPSNVLTTEKNLHERMLNNGTSKIQTVNQSNCRVDTNNHRLSPLLLSPTVSLTPAEERKSDEDLLATATDDNECKDRLSPTQFVFRHVRENLTRTNTQEPIKTCTTLRDPISDKQTTIRKENSASSTTHLIDSIPSSRNTTTTYSESPPMFSKFSMQSIKDGFRYLNSSQSSEKSDDAKEEIDNVFTPDLNQKQNSSVPSSNNGSLSPLSRLRTFRYSFRNRNKPSSHLVNPDDDLFIANNNSLELESEKRLSIELPDAKEKMPASRTGEEFQSKSKLINMEIDQIVFKSSNESKAEATYISQMNDTGMKDGTRAMDSFNGANIVSENHHVISEQQSISKLENRQYSNDLYASRDTKPSQQFPQSFSTPHNQYSTPEIDLSENDELKSDHETNEKSKTFSTSTEDISKKARELFLQGFNKKIFSFSSSNNRNKHETNNNEKSDQPGNMAESKLSSNSFHVKDPSIIKKQRSMSVTERLILANKSDEILLTTSKSFQSVSETEKIESCFVKNPEVVYSDKEFAQWNERLRAKFVSKTSFENCHNGGEFSAKLCENTPSMHTNRRRSENTVKESKNTAIESNGDAKESECIAKESSQFSSLNFKKSKRKTAHASSCSSSKEKDTKKEKKNFSTALKNFSLKFK